MNVMLDQELIDLSGYSLADTVLAYVGMVGSTTTIFSLLIFIVWGIFHVVRFFRNIIKA